MIHIVLYRPEIHPNTGNIARLCAANGLPLHIVGEPGFRLDDRSVRRAGLDYWPYVDLRRQADLEENERKEEAAKSLEQKRKEAAALKKQQEKERKQLQRQKAKEAKEREKQRKKELKERERLNKQRQKEREAQRKAEQRARAAAATRR